MFACALFSRLLPCAPSHGLSVLSVLLPLPWTALLACLGVLLDGLVGEPRRAHPLVGFGRLAARVERWMNRAGDDAVHAAEVGWLRDAWRRCCGVLAWSVMVLPPTAAAVWLIAHLPFTLACAVHVLLLWFALGACSLHDHLAPIARALTEGDLIRARALTARIVSRDTADADAAALARAAVESALENGNDAIFGALFWFALVGGPGALAFRLLNTLDAMWGYRTPRLLAFGWAAARLDDLANWLPARLTAASYVLCGDTRRALHCWQTQASAWDSPNAGPVMAAGAGSLGVQLGGPARYHGRIESRPTLGSGAVPVGADIGRALRLVRQALAVWLATLVVLGLAAVLSGLQHG